MIEPPLAGASQGLDVVTDFQTQSDTWERFSRVVIILRLTAPGWLAEFLGFQVGRLEAITDQLGLAKVTSEYIERVIHLYQ